MRGWVQGYNAQAVCNEQHLIIAAEVMTASPDFGHLGPMVTAARRELANAGVTKPPDVVVADAGYWHLEQMNEITGDGIPVLIPPDSGLRTKPRPGWDGGYYAFMRHVLSRSSRLRHRPTASVDEHHSGGRRSPGEIAGRTQGSEALCRAQRRCRSSSAVSSARISVSISERLAGWSCHNTDRTSNLVSACPCSAHGSASNSSDNAVIELMARASGRRWSSPRAAYSRANGAPCPR
jgi:hypothetical protein